MPMYSCCLVQVQSLSHSVLRWYLRPRDVRTWITWSRDVAVWTTWSWRGSRRVVCRQTPVVLFSSWLGESREVEFWSLVLWRRHLWVDRLGSFHQQAVLATRGGRLRGRWRRNCYVERCMGAADGDKRHGTGRSVPVQQSGVEPWERESRQSVRWRSRSENVRYWTRKPSRERHISGMHCLGHTAEWWWSAIRMNTLMGSPRQVDRTHCLWRHHQNHTISPSI